MPVVLVVDDEHEVRALVKQVIEREGHEVVEARDGLEALFVLGERGIQLALVDVVMPNMNGVELMQRMQDGYPETKIVTMSAFGRSWICPTELTVEASLTKPFDLKDLRKVLRHVLQKSNPPKRTSTSKRPRRT
jgi:DNA-binding NtrC family response regulator